MLEGFQSEILYAIGTALIHSIWQVACIWAIVTVIIQFSSKTATIKYYLNTLGSICASIVFIATSVLVYTSNSYSNFGTPIVAAHSIQDIATAAKGITLLNALQLIQILAPYFSLCYLMVLLFLVIKFSTSLNQTFRLKQYGITKAKLDMRLFVQKHVQLLHINRKVTVFFSSKINSPLTLGFWKPIILLPIAAVNNMSITQVESILLHELVHIKRYDYVLNLLLEVSEILLFFNPFAKLLNKQARLERELSCDDWVIQFKYKPKEYAEALLLCCNEAKTNVLALSANGESSYQLLNRVRRMMQNKQVKDNSLSKQHLLLAIPIVLLLLSFIIPLIKTTNNKLPVVHQLTYQQSNEATIYDPFSIWYGNKVSPIIEVENVNLATNSIVNPIANQLVNNSGLNHNSTSAKIIIVIPDKPEKTVIKTGNNTKIQSVNKTLQLEVAINALNKNNKRSEERFKVIGLQKDAQTKLKETVVANRKTAAKQQLEAQKAKVQNITSQCYSNRQEMGTSLAKTTNNGVTWVGEFNIDDLPIADLKVQQIEAIKEAIVIITQETRALKSQLHQLNSVQINQAEAQIEIQVKALENTFRNLKELNGNVGPLSIDLKQLISTDNKPMNLNKLILENFAEIKASQDKKSSVQRTFITRTLSL